MRADLDLATVPSRGTFNGYHADLRAPKGVARAHRGRRRVHLQDILREPPVQGVLDLVRRTVRPDHLALEHLEVVREATGDEEVGKLCPEEVAERRLTSTARGTELLGALEAVRAWKEDARAIGSMREGDQPDVAELLLETRRDRHLERGPRVARAQRRERERRRGRARVLIVAHDRGERAVAREA